MWGAIASAASGLASGIGSIFSSMRNTDKTNQVNKDLTRETNAINKQIADQNLAFQQENLEYQKALQQQIFEREDSAYERTVNDMRNAGLSPLSMSGTNGAGQAIQTEAMNNSYQHSQYQHQAYDLSALATISQTLSNLAYTSAETDKLRSEARKANAEADKVIFGNDIDKLFGKELAMFNHENAFYDLQRKRHDTDYMMSNGLADSMTNEERKAALVANSLGLGSDNFHYLKGASGKDYQDWVSNIGGVVLMSSVADVLKNLVPDISLKNLNFRKLK